MSRCQGRWRELFGSVFIGPEQNFLPSVRFCSAGPTLSLEAGGVSMATLKDQSVSRKQRAPSAPEHHQRPTLTGPRWDNGVSHETSASGASPVFLTGQEAAGGSERCGHTPSAGRSEFSSISASSSSLVTVFIEKAVLHISRASALLPRSL